MTYVILNDICNTYIIFCKRDIAMYNDIMTYYMTYVILHDICNMSLYICKVNMTLLQNMVFFIGLFYKRDLHFWENYLAHLTP